MPSTKEIRRRVKSVKSTRQITKAMELVAAAKMRKAQVQTLATRSYAQLAWQLIKNLTNKTDPRMHRLLRRPQRSGKSLIVLMTSNRGLIGAFNNNIAAKALEYARLSPSADFVTLGKKGREAVRKSGFNIVADFEKHDSAASVLAITPVANFVIGEFLAGKCDVVTLVYMDFVSTLVQRPHVLELLPVQKPDPSLGPEFGLELADSEYLFEPSADVLLETILPRLTSMQIYQALLETNAAEHSARMVAMKNATDAAGDIISELTLEYNQLRQSNITKEISEIVSGKLALT
ncbi:MAG: ATP synthase F1 subunit gamma [Candidatus Doudnabacteria bacterium RIFCSPHIGHO2_01_FULL_49_9]|uniref:ATP synthase gamma chain n=1 Tax=Candidatus Doudnabacteria bacterium RIFCSPHIGHO2_01_FULL_49_9 TaxID=1817827 RepID=A0A1F5P264_9BACT|nr:MAG: ATP synthase F1 subunit gamma [Candidatus Doudnabacteria bacterium RIFCSPHIGHO2_01_FULL_49_9]